MYKHFGKILLAVAVLTASNAATAQEEEPVYDNDSVRCINVRSIRRTDVVDDRNILFHVSGRRVYHNILSSRCGGLAREDRFSYRTTLGQLCDLDLIRVLHNDPFGLREGNSCRLGQFHEMTREDAEAFKEGAGKAPPAEPLPLPEPEEVGVSKESERPES